MGDIKIGGLTGILLDGAGMAGYLAETITQNKVAYPIIALTLFTPCLAASVAKAGFGLAIDFYYDHIAKPGDVEICYRRSKKP